MLVPRFRGIDSINVFNIKGGTGVAEGNIKFQEDIKHLLETPLGSVIGNLNYGSNLYRLLFLPARESTGSLIQEEVRHRIEDNYPSIKIDSVDVTYEGRTYYVSIGINNGNSNVIDYIDLNFTSGGES